MYNNIAEWSLADTKERIASYILGRLSRFGRSAADEIRLWNSRRELETCHVAQELLLLATVLDRLVRSEDGIVNSDDQPLCSPCSSRRSCCAFPPFAAQLGPSSARPDPCTTPFLLLLPSQF